MVATKKGRYSIAGRLVVDTSTLFGNGKTHVPISVRNLLGVVDGSNLVWVVEGDKVVVESASG